MLVYDNGGSCNQRLFAFFTSRVELLQILSVIPRGSRRSGTERTLQPNTEDIRIMRIFTTTNDFKYKGLSYPGIPFLSNEDMELIKITNDYLLWLSLENSNTSSPATWRSHAESLYDYFSWLEANDLHWDENQKTGKHHQEISNIALYRNWSLDLINMKDGTNKIQPSTVRKRLVHLTSFYKWAFANERINFIPWNELSRVVRTVRTHPTMYQHTRAATITSSNDLYPKVRGAKIQLLSMDQCKELLHACRSETLHLMTKIMLQSGLRNAECRTFPRKYIFDPDLANRNQRIPINLSPRDMSIKGQKPRTIYVSWQLMKELFDYLNFGEGAQRAKIQYQNTKQIPSLTFLNHSGEAWSDKGLNNAYRKLWESTAKENCLKFKVTPHMLRHTFATFELYAESQRRNLASALAWVRDRLGHSSINVTTVYVHCLDMLGEHDLNQYQNEIDSIMNGGIHEKK
jgi:integrase